MTNIFMLYFRLTSGHPFEHIANKLKISVNQYKELERAEITLTPKLARRLGQLYKVHGSYFQESAGQLELLHTRGEVIRILQDENKRMNELLKGGYELIKQSKELESE